MDTGSLDRLRTVIGVLDENLTTIARELSLSTRIDGTKIVLSGEAAEAGASVIRSLLTVVDAGELIDRSSLLYCISLAREGDGEEFGAALKDVVAVTSRGKPVKCKTVGQQHYVAAMRENTVTFGTGPAGTGKIGRAHV